MDVLDIIGKIALFVIFIVIMNKYNKLKQIINKMNESPLMPSISNTIDSIEQIVDNEIDLYLKKLIIDIKFHSNAADKSRIKFRENLISTITNNIVYSNKFTYSEVNHLVTEKINKLF